MSRLLYTIVLFALPVIVAAFHWHWLFAVLAVIALLVWRQVLVLGALGRRPAGAELELETLLPSHFSEKGRWTLDRLGVPYDERRMGGVIGVFFRGRTVPMLTVQTGRTRSSLCESSAILRFLYGRYLADPDVDTAWLEPTAERLEWEHRIDRYGVSQQVWIYHFLLKDPSLCKAAWGADSPGLPAWQRWAIKLLYPLLEGVVRRGFDPSPENYRKAVKRTEALLASTEELLVDGRKSLLSGDTSDFVDLTLASLSAFWLEPPEFAAGAYEVERIPREQQPEGLIADAMRWRENYPATTAHLERLYREERMTMS
ncbi:MAG: glutathione S-transferase N-terminal domain-containing protein [Pseudomonadota bacterium]